MPRRRARLRRSRGEWAIRSALVLAVACLAYVSVTRSIASTIKVKAVEQAHRLAPGNGPITALLSEKLSGPYASAADRLQADRLARLALRQDPTVVGAIATLGLNAQIRDDTAAARRLFAYSEKLSRRDLRTELWAIEDAVGRGDVDLALRHYDIALRTSRYAPDLLFPVLSAAIADPAVRTGLIGTLLRKPPWGSLFIEYVGGNGPAPLATVDLFHALHRANLPVSELAGVSVVNALISAGHPDDAWAYYAFMRPGSDRRRSRDPMFRLVSDRPAFFDWQTVENNAIASSIQRGDQGGIFDFAAPAMIGGVALRQVQMLPPGRYRLEGHSPGIDVPEAARPYWVLGCRGGSEIGRVTVPVSVQADGQFAGDFTVPADCPMQELSLVVRPADGLSGAAGQFDRVQLRPMS